jgi:hypothetical protein
MRKTTKAAWLAVPLAGFLLLAACGDDSGSSSATTGGGAATTAGGGAATTAAGGAATTGAGGGAEATSLKGVCPDPVIVQTDWNPEAEHGGLYQLVGTNPSVDSSKKAVTGELMASGGVDTGVKIEVRVGGPAIGFQQVTAQLYTDDSILLGYVSNDEAVQNSADKPTVALMAPLKKNPQIVMWDPATYPDAKTIADLPKDTTILVFDGGVFPDYLVGKGIVQQSQIEGGYDGTPARFVASDGKIAQQGFASAEPYIYENEVPEWGKPVAFQLIHDTGLEIYSQTMSTRPENVTKYSDCFKKLIPIMQQADVDFAKDPAATNALIVDLVKQYDTGWVYSQGVADFSVQQQVKLELVGNEDGYSGGMDEARVQGVIDNLLPIFNAKGVKVKDGLTAKDIMDLQFVDKNIQF